MSCLNIHKELHLYASSGKIYLQPVNNPSEALVIDKEKCHIQLNNDFSTRILPPDAKSSLIYGVIGIKQILGHHYLIVITKATKIGLINDEPIYRMEASDIIPFRDGILSHNSAQQTWHSIYIAMLESVLKMPHFYFSYSFDVTNSLERIQNNSSHSGDKGCHHYYDKRFLWNKDLMGEFDRCGQITDKYRIPFILGFISINRIDHNGNFTLISRRDNRRAGTRFNSRGIDDNGCVSNFVETEQILDFKDKKASLVQVRGSIPLYWSQKPDYSYKPPIQVSPYYDHSLAMRKHLDELRSIYGSVTVCSLIDRKGHEKLLGEEFYKFIREMTPSLPYHQFDFHKECSKMRYERIDILMEAMNESVRTYGYFAMGSSQILSMQRGVIRTNCIDSLDRTNVLQSVYAERVLRSQMNDLKITDPNLLNEWIAVFKNTWADNADALSIQYAGTPALKTDFTRTGKRTQAGLINDGLNSLTRYVLNNFCDSYRQDAIDLFLGHYEGYPSPLYKPMELTSYASTLPITLVVLTLVALYIYFRV